MQNRTIIFVLDSNLINVQFLIRKYWWEKTLKLINVRLTFIRHLRVHDPLRRNTAMYLYVVKREMIWNNQLPFKMQEMQQIFKNFVYSVSSSAMVATMLITVISVIIRSAIMTSIPEVITLRMLAVKSWPRSVLAVMTLLSSI